MNQPRKLFDWGTTSQPSSGTFPARWTCTFSPGLRHIPPSYLQIDRARAQSVGMQSRDVAQNVLVSLSSQFSDQPRLLGWIPKTAWEYSRRSPGSPQYRVDHLSGICRTLPISGVLQARFPKFFGNLVQTSTTARPAEISHYTTQPMINVYASVDGRDLGGVADQVEERRSGPSKKTCLGAATIVTRGQAPDQ